MIGFIGWLADTLAGCLPSASTPAPARRRLPRLEAIDDDSDDGWDLDDELDDEPAWLGRDG